MISSTFGHVVLLSVISFRHYPVCKNFGKVFLGQSCGSTVIIYQHRNADAFCKTFPQIGKYTNTIQFITEALISQEN